MVLLGCMLSLQLKRSINYKMLTLMDKMGIACMAIVGFQLSKFVLKVLYRTVVAPQIGRINVNKLKDMGEYACKYLNWIKILMTCFWTADLIAMQAVD